MSQSKLTSTDSASRQTAPSQGTPAQLIITVMSILCMLGVGAWVWNAKVKPQLYPKRFGIVEPGKIYRAGQISGGLIRSVLKENEIQIIIDLNGDKPGVPDRDAEIDIAKELGVTHLSFPLRGDGTGDIRNYASAIEALVNAKKENKRVLVHCSAGSQRTGGCIAFYQLLLKTEAANKVYQDMTHYGVDPDRDKALLDYMSKNMGELAKLLVERGVIDKVPEPLPTLPH